MNYNIKDRESRYIKFIESDIKWAADNHLLNMMYRNAGFIYGLYFSDGISKETYKHYLSIVYDTYLSNYDWVKKCEVSE